ncbi:prepilin-type N-terminal cleavage/methylation domain-containing protein [Nocardioides dongxiaopingii]|uniref:prepilin-type N-terminal cleavage/methylation domain-containing protein n=1 Tax=Nocardioides dongxiaopingii TaxID=2576036 RepID=UPI0010C767EF
MHLTTEDSGGYGRVLRDLQDVRGLRDVRGCRWSGPRGRRLKRGRRGADAPGMLQTPHRRAPSCPGASPHRDRGMTLIEVIVAVALFGVLSSAVLVVVTSMIDVSNDDGRRTVAGNLAARELEITREVFASQTRGPERVAEGRNKNPLPGGTVGQPLVVDGIPYTVVTTVDDQQLDKAYASTCDQDNGNFAFKSVHVEVTWDGMGGREPVVMDTIMTPPKGSYIAGAGHIGVKVIDALGLPRAGVTVTARSTTSGATTGSVVTSEDGCALLLNQLPGSYEVRATAAGFVSQQGEAAPTLTANVQTGMLWKGSFFYDKAASMEIGVCPPPDGYPLPTSFASTPISLGHPSLLPAGAKAFASTATRSREHCEFRDDDGEGKGEQRDAEVRRLNNLWPYPSGYQSWVGSCAPNDPAWTGYETPGRDQPVGVEPGSVSRTITTLQPITVRLPPLTPLRAVEAVPLSSVTTAGAGVACPGGATITLIPVGSVTLGATMRTSLPIGLWRVQRAGGAGTTTVILVTKDAPVQAVVL